MNPIDYTKEFPDEEANERKLKECRVREGVVCPKCGYVHHHRKNDKKCFECKQSHYRQSLTANTVMHWIQLPLMSWFMVVRYIKMIVINDLEADTIDTKVKDNIEPSSTIIRITLLLIQTSSPSCQPPSPGYPEGKDR